MIPYPSDRMILNSEYDRGYANGQKDAETYICPFYEIDDDGHGICKNDRYMDKIARFKDRTEQRQVVETFTDMLMPMMKYLNEETKEKIEIGLRILSGMEIEGEQE